MRFLYGTLKFEYDLLLQDRKTISLTVRPDSKIIVKAPLDITEEKIDLFLKKKWQWIKKQTEFFKNHSTKIYRREYVTGEEYLFLGKQYKLVVKKSDGNNIKLIKNEMFVHVKETSESIKYVKSIIRNWYKDQILEIFRDRLSLRIKMFHEYPVPLLTIREMDKRWGSFTGTNQIILNPRLIFTSLECIDYVIVHELCHMKYKNHGKLFFELLETKYPRWKKIKDKLENYRIRDL